MPGPLFEAYAEMLPRLQAEDAIRMVTAVAIGAGKAKKAEARRIMRDWNRTAGRGRESATRITTMKGAAAALEAMGLTRG